MQKRRQLSTLALALVFVMVFASVAGAVTVPTNVYYTDPATSQVVRADYGAASDAFDTGNTAMWNALRQGLLNALRGGKSVIVETTTGAIDYLNAALDGKTLDEAAQDPNFSTTTPTPTKELKTDGTVGEPAPSTVAITNIAATKAFGVFKFETATATTVEALTGKVKANGVAVTGIAMKESNTNGTQWVATVPDAVANTDYVITFEAPFDGTEIINFAKPALAVSSVSAINATTIEVTFAEAVTEVPEGLVILQDGVDLALAADKFAVADGKVVATVPEVLPTAEEQSIVYSAKLGDAAAVAADPFVIPADADAAAQAAAETAVAAYEAATIATYPDVAVAAGLKTAADTAVAAVADADAKAAFEARVTAKKTALDAVVAAKVAAVNKAATQPNLLAA